MPPSRSALATVVIPAFNAAAFLADAIASVQAQDCGPPEIIVVDDGSTDPTAAVASRFGSAVRYVYQENGGPAAARNTGVRLARGERIAFLDADDLWPPGSLSALSAHLDSGHPRQAVIGRTQLLLLDPATGEYRPFREPGYITSLTGGLYRKEIFDRVGLLDPAFRQGEDVDWFLRVREAGIAIEMIETTTLYYRLHTGNLTRNRPENQRFFVTALKRSLDRRRRRN